MNYIDLEGIREPIWYGKKGRHISIGTYKITDPAAMYRIGIVWKNKEDIQRYTKKFVMRGRDIMAYEAKPYKNYPDTSGYWIPLKDLQEEVTTSDICIEHNAIKLADGRCVMEVAL